MTTSLKSNKIKVSSLKKEDIMETSELIVNTFNKEGITRFAHNEKKEKYNHIFKAIGELKLKLYLETSQIVLAAKQDDKIVGLAIMKSNDMGFFKMVKAYFPQVLFYFIPLLRSMRFRNAINISRLLKLKTKLKQPYYSLEALGVHENFQGKGIGKLLLNRLDEILFNQTEKNGINLFTADKPNNEIYESKGYQLIETNKADDITVYHMYKERDKVDIS